MKDHHDQLVVQLTNIRVPNILNASASYQDCKYQTQSIPSLSKYDVESATILTRVYMNPSSGTNLRGL